MENRGEENLTRDQIRILQQLTSDQVRVLQQLSARRDQVDVLQQLAALLIELRGASWVLKWLYRIWRWGGWIVCVIIAYRTGSLSAVIKFLTTGS